MKVVFDTNVRVSAFVTEGVCSKLLGRARRRQFQLIPCPFIPADYLVTGDSDLLDLRKF